MESIFDIHINDEVYNKIILDSEENQVNSKSYQISSEKDMICVTGKVDEYEPESIRLKFGNLSHKKRTQMGELIESYEFAFGSGTGYRSVDDSLLIYKRGVELLKRK